MPGIDDDWRVKSSTASALEIIGGEKSIRILEKLTNDDNEYVRVSAAVRIEKIELELKLNRDSISIYKEFAK